MTEKRPELERRLWGLYGREDGTACYSSILRRIEAYSDRFTSPAEPRWDERDIVLITYADQIRRAGQPTLRVLRDFLASRQLDRLLNTVHLLPFFPYSSDDGFSVIDYRKVQPIAGNWPDVAQLAKQQQLMFDLVLNHTSQESHWFQSYLAGEPPFTNYFIEVDPAVDVSQVTRPRSLPLLTPFQTTHGTRHVWTTFSADQVDLNFANPAVLVEMIDVLLFYIAQGARIVRLDAIAYLWKEVGTTCIHLPQTHEVVRVLRDVVDIAAPHVILLTETNVPHAENVSYFGNGDEAHMVYQFSLPPLLLDAFLQQDATYLVSWLRHLQSPRVGTTYFNFTASHDGIGVRPLEGLVPAERIETLARVARERGGHVGLKRNPDGSDSPYELNITYLDMLGEAGQGQETHARRFLATQAIMLGLQGIPGVYFHSLVGSPNDEEAARAAGIPRRINRHKYVWDELAERLDAAGSLSKRVFEGYQKLLACRIAQPAFHPDATQQVLDLDHPHLIAFARIAPDGRQKLLVLANVSDQSYSIESARLGVGDAIVCWKRDLLGHPVNGESRLIDIPAFATMWLVA